MIDTIDYWVFRYEVWIILGIALIALDLLVGLNFFALALGAAALTLAVLVFAETEIWYEEALLLDDWHDMAIAYGVLSVAEVYLIKRFFKRSVDDKPDINKY
ncbi:hypothetical protein KAJ83_04670 [Marivibrio halodurans]|uniref:Uncharacterized protein n=1 Tax=Marivibrio halodurans TaxID=2039722 RepID=A0A8J7V1F2_9PROT|nr:hypothetical protein [Marivibrio halodurans]MBP5856290.1 hypothetical protein [Marivibrio halodurans]